MSELLKLVQRLSRLGENKSKNFDGTAATLSGDMLKRLPATSGCDTNYSLTRTLVSAGQRALFRESELLFRVEQSRTFCTTSFTFKTSFRGTDLKVNLITPRIDAPPTVGSGEFNAVRVQEAEQALVARHIDEMLSALVDLEPAVFEAFFKRVTDVEVYGFGGAQWGVKTKQFNTVVERSTLRLALTDALKETVAEMERDSAFIAKLDESEKRWLKYAADEYVMKRAAEAAAAKEAQAAQATPATPQRDNSEYQIPMAGVE